MSHRADRLVVVSIMTSVIAFATYCGCSPTPSENDTDLVRAQLHAIGTWTQIGTAPVFMSRPALVRVGTELRHSPAGPTQRFT